MASELMLRKARELEKKGYKFIRPSKDGCFAFLAWDDPDDISKSHSLIISTDIEASRIYAEFCEQNQGNPVIPKIFEHAQEGVFYITKMERLKTLREVTQDLFAKKREEGHITREQRDRIACKVDRIWRNARTFINFMADYDPCNQSKANHDEVYACMDSEPDLHSLAEHFTQTLSAHKDQKDYDLFYDLDSETAMFRDSGDFVFVESFRTLENWNLVKRLFSKVVSEDDDGCVIYKRRHRCKIEGDALFKGANGKGLPTMIAQSVEP